jgi:CHAT domain-containing protein
MILTSETRKKPALVVLPNGNELETKYMKNYLSSVKYKVEDKHSYQQYWEQIDTQLKGKSVVYFSPDGVYNQLNVNTFKRSDGTYILDQYNLHIMTSTKDVVLLDSELKAGLGTQVATLFGFPQYDLKHSSIETFVEERSLERSRNVEREIDLTRFGFAELPGTKTETESIVEILSANEWDAKLYLGDEALEEAIKSVSSPNVLHIATHGFFLDDVERKDQVQLGVSTQHSRKNPLLRSGLLLAGAAQTVQGDYQNKTENGILTAYEAMNLDLNDTDLVVLSACETGRGEVKSGEGVYGLQRAFQVAGAESLIMSLWKVNDDATQLLMTNFYQNWLSGLNKNEAFKKAQMTVRAQFSAPYYWGAFVMVGN